MSQYLEFYLKVNNTANESVNFIPLASYSSSNYIYHALWNYVTYGKVTSLSKENLEEFVNKFNSTKNEYEMAITNIEAKKNFLKDLDNTIEEKLETYNELEKELKNYKESIEICVSTIAIFNFLYSIIEEIQYTSDESNCFPSLSIAYDQCIYAGIDCGKPTEELIID